MPSTAQAIIEPSITSRAETSEGSAALQLPREVVADVGADHVDVAVREVDQAQDAVDHRVAQGDQGVDRPERQAVDQLLEEGRHAEESRAPRRSAPARPYCFTVLGLDGLGQEVLAVLDLQDDGRS